MCSYLYELPTTGAIAFGDFLYDQSASYVSEVSDTTEARANLRAVLAAHGMAPRDVAKVTVFLTDRSLIGPWRARRDASLTSSRVSPSTLRANGPRIEAHRPQDAPMGAYRGPGRYRCPRSRHNRPAIRPD